MYKTILGASDGIHEIEPQQVGILFTRSEGYEADSEHVLAFMSPLQVLVTLMPRKKIEHPGFNLISLN